MRWTKYLMGCQQTKQRTCTEYVPCSTLKDRTGGKVIHGSNPGPKPYYLNAEEERELVNEASNIGYGKTCRDVLSLVESYVKKKRDFSLRYYT